MFSEELLDYSGGSNSEYELSDGFISSIQMDSGVITKNYIHVFGFPSGSQSCKAQSNELLSNVWLCNGTGNGPMIDPIPWGVTSSFKEASTSKVLNSYSSNGCFHIDNNSLVDFRKIFMDLGVGFISRLDL